MRASVNLCSILSPHCSLLLGLLGHRRATFLGTNGSKAGVSVPSSHARVGVRSNACGLVATGEGSLGWRHGCIGQRPDHSPHCILAYPLGHGDLVWSPALDNHLGNALLLIRQRPHQSRQPAQAVRQLSIRALVFLRRELPLVHDVVPFPFKRLSASFRNSPATAGIVMPAQAGIHTASGLPKTLGSRFCGDDAWGGVPPTPFKERRTERFRVSALQIACRGGVFVSERLRQCDEAIAAFQSAGGREMGRSVEATQPSDPIEVISNVHTPASPPSQDGCSLIGRQRRSSQGRKHASGGFFLPGIISCANLPERPVSLDPWYRGIHAR